MKYQSFGESKQKWLAGRVVRFLRWPRREMEGAAEPSGFHMALPGASATSLFGFGRFSPNRFDGLNEQNHSASQLIPKISTAFTRNFTKEV